MTAAIVLLMTKLIDDGDLSGLRSNRIAIDTRTDRNAELTNLDHKNELECSAAEKEVRILLGRSRSCQVDSDCTLAHRGCPFGCITAVADSAVSSIYELERTFQTQCHDCVYSCEAPVFKWNAVCVRGNCRVADGTSENLKKETLELIRLEKDTANAT